MPVNLLPCQYAYQIKDPITPNRYLQPFFSRPQLFNGGIAPVVIFFNPDAIWGYYLDGNLAWTFETTRQNVVNGWTTPRACVQLSRIIAEAS